MSGLGDLVDVLASSRLTYGKPVTHGDRTVIPVTRVRVAGGWGLGRGSGPGKASRATGQGGGGSLDALPAGFIELGPDGSRFHEIPDPDRTQRLLKAGAGAVVTLATVVAGTRRLGAGRRGPAGLLGRGR